MVKTHLKMKKKNKKASKKVMINRSINYADAKKVCEEKITLSHLRNDRYRSQNQLGKMAELLKSTRKRDKESADL